MTQARHKQAWEAASLGVASFATTLAGVLTYHYIAAPTIPGVSSSSGSGSSSSSGGFAGNLIHAVTKAVTSGVQTIISTIFTQINNFISGITQKLLGVITSFIGAIGVIPTNLAKLLGTLFSLPISFLKSLTKYAQYGLTGRMNYHYTLPGQAQHAHILVSVITAFLIMGAGIAVIQLSGGLTTLTSLGGNLDLSGMIASIGAIIMVVGATIGLYGVVPQDSAIIFAAMFAGILIVAALDFKGILENRLLNTNG